MKLGEFFVELGVKSNLGSVKDFAKAIGDIPLEVAGAVVAIGAMEYRLLELGKQITETAINFKVFEAQTGLSSQELQDWQRVADRTGISTESVTASIKALQQNMVALRYGRGNYMPFAMLGVSPFGKDPFQMLEQLRSVMKSMPRDVFSYWTQQLGVSSEMLRVLDLDDKKFQEFMHHAHGLTPQVERDFSNLSVTLRGWGQTIRDYGITYLDNLLRTFEALFDHLHKIPGALSGIAGAMTALLIGLNPMLAGITALVLLLEDLAVYALGGKSAIGLVIDKFKDTDFKKLFEHTIPHKALDFANYLGNSSVVRGFNHMIGYDPAAIQRYFTGGSTVTIYTSSDKPETIAHAVAHELTKHNIKSRVQINNNAVKRQ